MKLEDKAKHSDIAEYRKFISVKDFGAVGDGLTDDTCALQAAIDAASIPPYNTMFIPAGIYLLGGARVGTNSALLIIKSNLSIIGDGYNAVLKVVDDYTTGGDYRVMAPIDSSKINNFSIKNVRFDGNGGTNLVAMAGEIRSAYSIKIFGGDNIVVEGCWFENNPGRGVLNFGDNTSLASICSVRIANNSIKNVGGAIPNNEYQNDHSSIYLQASRGLVANNFFSNDVSVNPFSIPSKAVVALEIHGNNTDVVNNIVNNYGTAGNLVASVQDSYNNSWVNNKFYNLTSNCLTLWSAGGFTNKRLTIRGNTIQIDNSTYSGGNGIYQNPLSSVTASPIQDLVIEDNIIYSDVSVPQSVTWHAINLVAVDNAKICRNVFRNIQGCAINIEKAATALNVNDVEIVENSFVNCGIHSPLSRIWAVRIINDVCDRVFHRINIARNTVRKNLQPVGQVPLGSRGFRIEGPGLLQDILVSGDNSYENIYRSEQVELVAPMRNSNVAVLPSTFAYARNTEPVSGYFNLGRTIIYNVDPIVGGSVGKYAVAAGAASSGLWSASVNYLLGQWIKTSTGKILECTVAGVSGAVEPAPSVLGAQIDDGAATWVYRDIASAKFVAYGASVIVGTAAYDPPMLALGSSVAALMQISAPSAVVGDFVDSISFSQDTKGLIFSGQVSATDSVAVNIYNPPDNPNGAVDLSLGDLTVSVRKA